MMEQLDYHDDGSKYETSVRVLKQYRHLPGPMVSNGVTQNRSRSSEVTNYASTSATVVETY
jgi:hypothetical protein